MSVATPDFTTQALNDVLNFGSNTATVVLGILASAAVWLTIGMAARELGKTQFGRAVYRAVANALAFIKQKYNAIFDFGWDKLSDSELIGFFDKAVLDYRKEHSFQF